MDDLAWRDPARPPVEAVDLGDGVWVSWASVFNETGHPLIWHWCDRSVWLAARDISQPVGTAENRMPEWYRPQWSPAGVKGHDLVSRDPLHLEPSLLWSDCCGKHGFIRDGRWQSV